MARVIEIPYRTTIIQPGRCVACGEKTSSDKTVSRTISKRTRPDYFHERVESLTISFRLCEACDHYSKIIPRSFFVAMGGMSLDLIGALVLVRLADTVSGGVLWWIVPVWMVPVMGGTIYLAIREWKREKKTIDYKRRKQVDQCVQIIDFSKPQVPHSEMTNIALSYLGLRSKAIRELYGVGFIKIRFENDAFAEDFAELNDSFAISA